jgi:uncharacterized protein YndB with AHSA1/START domain
MDVRVGGQWLFTMHGSDGTDYPNRVRYTDVREPELLAYDHDDGGKAERPLAFQVVITFTEEAQKTRVTLRLICGSKEQREMMAKFGAVEGAHQTLSRLEDYLLGGKPEARAARQGARS